MVGLKILEHISFTSFVLFFFFAVLQLNLRKKLLLNYFLAGLYFTGGYFFFYSWIFTMGLLARLPFLINTEIAICYAIGPFLYLYFCAVSGIKEKKKLYLLFHFIPLFVSLICIVSMNLMSTLPLSVYRASERIFPDYSYHRLIAVFELLSNLSLAFYFFLTLLRVSVLFRPKKNVSEIRIILVFLLLLALSVTLLIIGRYTQLIPLMIFSTGCFAFLPMYYMFFSFRYPELSLKALKEAKTMRYEKSIIKNLDIDLVLHRLNELMEEEKLYADEDLSLERLSSYLKITPRQLSQILNDRLQRNFRSFVNNFRIEEAKKLLENSPDYTILDIAFEVGFNSKSSFYSSFIKETGDSPSNYRKSLIYSTET